MKNKKKSLIKNNNEFMNIVKLRHNNQITMLLEVILVTIYLLGLIILSQLNLFLAFGFIILFVLMSLIIKGSADKKFRFLVQELKGGIEK